jgi:hypothetical protein
LIQVLGTIIEPPFALLQMQIESAIGNSIELLESTLCVTPKALNAIDEVGAPGELVGSVLNSEML